MIGRELFCQLINLAIDEEQKSEKLAKALQEYAGDKDFTGFFTNRSNQIVQILTQAFGDKDELISWWMWETEHGTIKKIGLKTIIFEDKREMVINTPDDLYSLLIQVYSLQETQKSIILKAQEAGVKLALWEIETGRHNVANYPESKGDINMVLSIVQNKIENAYMKESGSSQYLRKLDKQGNLTIEKPTIIHK